MVCRPNNVSRGFLPVNIFYDQTKNKEISGKLKNLSQTITARINRRFATEQKRLSSEE